MGEQIRSYFGAGLGRVTGFLPNLLAAIVIAVVGYALSRLAGSVCRRLLARVGFDGWAARHLHPRAAGTRRPASAVLGSVTFGLGLLITAAMTANALQLYALGAGLNRILAFVPNVLVAGIIVGVAVAVGNLLASLIDTVTSPTLARAAKAAVIVLAAFMALDQLGVSHGVVLTMFTAFVGALAVAAAVAFGVGNIGLARDLTRRLAERTRARTEAATREREAPTIVTVEPAESTKH
jgi:hypothetical protein